VVCYKISLLNEFIARHIVKYTGIVSLANIVHGKMVFPELLQQDANVVRITSCLEHWLNDQKAYQKSRDELKQTINLLQGEDFSIPDYMGKVIEEIYN
jgi:lipid-A-disaccharide synthase